MGRPDDAISFLHRSRTTFQRAEGTSHEVALLDHIGVAYRIAGRHEEAIADHLLALARVDGSGNRLTYGAMLVHLGLTYQRAGHFADAIAVHTRSIAILREAGIPDYLGTVTAGDHVIVLAEPRMALCRDERGTPLICHMGATSPLSRRLNAGRRRRPG